MGLIKDASQYTRVSETDFGSILRNCKILYVNTEGMEVYPGDYVMDNFNLGSKNLMINGSTWDVYCRKTD